MNLKEYIDTRTQYLSYITSVRGLSVRTAAAYETDLRKFEQFLSEQNLDYLTLTPRDVRSFLAELQRSTLSASTVNRVLSGIKGFYTYAVRYGITDRDPFDRVKTIKERRRLPSVLTEQEVRQLLDAPGDGFSGIRDSVIFHVLYSTGCRLSELLAVNVEHMHLDRGEILVRGKGDKDRYVFLTDEAVSLLELYLPMKQDLQNRNQVPPDDRDALVINNRGRRMSPQGVHYIFEQYCLSLGLAKHVTPHTLRHSFATHILDRDAGIRVVQKLLGHEHISTTQIYSHVGIERLRKVYEKAHPHGRRK